MNLTPLRAAICMLLLAAALLVAGVLQLAGPGWATLAAALPVFVAGLVLLRGSLRAMKEPTDG